MMLNREAKTTGSMCIALLRRITFEIEVVNGVHFAVQYGNYRTLARENFLSFCRLEGIIWTDTCRQEIDPSSSQRLIDSRLPAPVCRSISTL